MDREPSSPASPALGSPDDPDWPHVVTADWVDEEEWARMCAVLGEDEEPPDPVQAFYDDPDCGPPPDWEQESFETLTARAEKDGAEYAELVGRLAAAGHSESAHVAGDPPVPGSPEGPAAGFGQGRPLDTAVPSTVICGLADEASGDGRAFKNVTDDQLMGLIGARARLTARQHWEQLTAVAEFIRRRPHPALGRGERLPGGMPAAPSDDAGADLAAQLHITGTMAGALTGLAHDLMVKLPLTRAALRDGIIDLGKARTIAVMCWPLTPAQARRAERILFGLDNIEEMTWGMIRDRIARAVMEVDPDAARRRREGAERTKRVEVFPELSGNTRISGRELPPAAALAADQNLDARARELRAAGVPGDMGNLRALAYLEMLGAGSPLDAIPAVGSPGNGSPGSGTGGPRDGTAGDGPGGGGNGGGGNGGRGPGAPDGRGAPGGGAVPGQVPPCFTAKVNLTIPLATLLGLAERPGTMSRTGPVDPALARTLAAAAARDPGSAWCVTVTGPDHRPVAHGCGRPPPRGRGNPGRVLLHPGRRPRPARNRDPATEHRRPHRHRRRRRRRGRRPGTGLRPGEPGRALRPRPRNRRARPRRQAQAPHRDPQRLLHLPALPPPPPAMRLRAQHPARPRRPDLPMPGRTRLPPQPPQQASPRLAPPARRGPRLVPLDHRLRPHPHQQTHPISRLTKPAAGPAAGSARQAAVRLRETRSPGS